jgi:hypothetical protein
MKETAAKLRAIADELERIAPKDDPSFKETFQLFELPDLIGSVVDYLQPELQPYDALIYWYMFRHSIIAVGDVFARVSNASLATGVGKSFRLRETSQLGTQAVREAIQRLVAKGAISIAGDTNREGTLYRVHLPEEIELCREAMSRAQAEALPKVDPAREVDFYNVRENRLKVFERDKYLCHHCGKLLTRFSATLDHLQPVTEGGDNSYGNLVTSCLHCNSQRGSQPLMDFLTKKRDPQR